ncbi:hypothetical protein PHYBOEH_007405 [Phytophthora boehmeriae]|uniref:Uncharacterized protein n=1 Tax=Phytophthora boehmeriae TaxID=109152 RepID=A0A8T1W7V0_9STRA|nr:hypothetical protein PHYBOEH_007405 [Phytophthora boehmeriae]
MTEQVLRDFELLLMTKHRFALADVVVCMQRTVQDLHEVERSLTVAAASVLSYPDSDKICADTLGRISGQLEHLVGIAPTFLGEQEVAEFINALRDFERLSEGLETDMMPDIMKLHRAMTSISGDMTLLSEAVARSKSVCGLMTEKRDYLMRFLEEAVQVLENSNSRRVVQYGNTVEQLTAEFKLALEDEHLQSAKQLRFGIQAIETSMSTMLLPHFEICRTITTAYELVHF